MSNYYFVGTLLSPLSFDTRPEMTLAQLDELLADNLTIHDYKKILIARRFYDVLNLRSLWLGEPLDVLGEMSKIELEEALANQVGLPAFVYKFVDTYEKNSERLHHFPLLLAKFFQDVRTVKDSFLRHYLTIERELRLVLTAFRAKKLGRSLSVELQYEDPEEELIAQLLAQQDATTYEPPEKYQDLKVLFDKYGNDPIALQRALDQYRFEVLDNLVDPADGFSIDRILAYFLQLILVSKWFELDRARGIEIVDTIVKEK
jgi:Protein of unknown function (DUF2764)